MDEIGVDEIGEFYYEIHELRNGHFLIWKLNHNPEKYWSTFDSWVRESLELAKKSIPENSELYIGGIELISERDEK